MLKFNKKIEYALLSIFEMADHGNHHPLTAKTIANRYSIPQEILGKVLQTLVKKKILISVQGVRGGYLLIRPLKKINILEIVEAFEGRLSLIPCRAGKIVNCEQVFRCTIKSPLEQVQTELFKFFKEISLYDLKNRQVNRISFEPVAPN